MSKFQTYKDLLFSTLAEITSLIIADNDKRLIFRKVLDCCLTVLEVERIYLLELQGNHIIRYSKSKDSGPGDTIDLQLGTRLSVAYGAIGIGAGWNLLLLAGTGAFPASLRANRHRGRIPR